MGKRWQKVEIAYLKKHAAAKSLKDLAARFHTDTATVETKLKDLRLDAAGSGEMAASEQRGLEAFQKGMKALYGSKWSQAEKLFRQVMSDSRQPELVSKARQMAKTAHERQLAESAEDPYLAAVYEKNRGELDQALALCKAGGRSGKDERFAYLAAAVYALKGDVGSGIESLRRAIDLEPRNRIHALHDQDLEPLRSAVEYGDLIG